MKTQLRSILAILLLIFLPFLLFSQNEESIISLAAEKEFSLTTDETNRLINIKENRLHKSVNFIEIRNIPEVAKANNGALPFKLPHWRRTLIAHPTSIEFLDDTTNYVWKGEFKGADGQVMLVHKDGEIFGDIRVDGEIFEIQSFREGRNILVEYDQKELVKKRSANPIINEPQLKESETYGDALGNEIYEDVAIKTVQGKPYVRILILYTSAAYNAVANIQNTAYLCWVQMRDAINYSGLFDYLDVGTASVQFIDIQEKKDNIVTTLNRLRLHTPQAKELRDFHQADLVVLLTHGHLYHDGFAIFGFPVPIESEPYAVVEVTKATASYTFAHEVAHLFGALDPPDYHPFGTYEYGHTFKTGTWPFRTDRRTIMYYELQGDWLLANILRYSNPDVYYKGVRTGTSTRNVARKIRETAPIVAAFRPYTPPLSVYITGPYEGYNGYFYTWYSHVSNGVAPYSYQWYHGPSNFGPWTPYQQGGTSANLTAQLPWNNNLYIRLRVTSSDNQTAYAHFDTWNNGTLGQMQEKSLIETNMDEQLPEEQTGMEMMEAELHLNISPNPVRDIATLDYYVIQKGLVRLELFDINGSKINDLLNEEKDKGFYTFTLHVQNLTKGVYICKLSVGKEQVSNMLIVE